MSRICTWDMTDVKAFYFLDLEVFLFHFLQETSKVQEKINSLIMIQYFGQ